MKAPNKSNGGLSAAFILCAIVYSLIAVGCITKTVRPETITDSAPSFDGGAQNSGMIDFRTNEAGAVSMEVTPHFRDRYNAMIPRYGTNFLPALKIDEGINAATNGNYLIDLDHLVKFNTMNRWRKQSI